MPDRPIKSPTQRRDLHSPIDDPRTVDPPQPDQNERFKDREIPQMQVSDEFLDPLYWDRELGYDPTHDRAQDAFEPEPSQMTRAGRYEGLSMLAFMVPEELARVLEEESREALGGSAMSWNQLHVTVCCFDNPEDQEHRDRVADVARKVCREYGPIDFKLTGIGQFDSEEGGFPTFATVDGMGLAAFRTDLVRALKEAGVPVTENHDYMPHLTLGYAETQGGPFPNHPIAEWTADGLDIVFNDAIEEGKVAQVPLSGPPRLAGNRMDEFYRLLKFTEDG